jgi:hypothetical protein
LNIDEIVSVLQERIEALSRYLKDHAECFVEQKHTHDHGSPERVYWHYGYLVATRDVLRLLNRNGGTPTGN